MTLHPPRSLVRSLALGIALACALLILVGCAAETVSTFDVGRTLTVRSDGSFNFVHTVAAASSARSTDNPAAPTTQSLSEAGITASAAGEQVKSSKDFAAETQATLFGWAAIAASVAAALLVWPARNFILAAAAGAVALVCFGYQTLQNPWVFAGLAASLAFLGWYVLRRSSRLKAGEPVTRAVETKK